MLSLYHCQLMYLKQMGNNLERACGLDQTCLIQYRHVIPLVLRPPSRSPNMFPQISTCPWNHKHVQLLYRATSLQIWNRNVKLYIAGGNYYSNAISGFFSRMWVVSCVIEMQELTEVLYSVCQIKTVTLYSSWECYWIQWGLFLNRQV